MHFTFTAHPTSGRLTHQLSGHCTAQCRFRRWWGHQQLQKLYCFLALLLAGPDRSDLGHSHLGYSLSSVPCACTFFSALTVSKQLEGTLPTLCFPFLVNCSGCRMVWTLHQVLTRFTVFLDLVSFSPQIEFEFLYDRKFRAAVSVLKKGIDFGCSC